MANIFILEPDNLLAGNLRSFFANANHTAYVHSDPQSALTTADEYKPDIVITNLQLAGRSGIEFLYEFRSYSDWQNIPVILLGHLRNEEMTQYTEVFSELNISSYIYKPSIKLNSLLLSVEQMLQPAS